MMSSERTHYKSASVWLTALRQDEAWLCQLRQLENSDAGDLCVHRENALRRIGKGETFEFWDIYNQVEPVVKEVWEIAELSLPKLKIQVIGMLSMEWINQKAMAVEEETVEEKEVETPKQEPKPQAVEEENVSFVERVKAIIRKAATKNGQQMVSREKGHVANYTYYINAEVFCMAIDQLASEQADDLLSFLGKDLNNTKILKVCTFIGNVIRMNIINNKDMHISDIIFAFQDYYPNKNTIKSRLSNKLSKSEYQRFFGTVKVILNKNLILQNNSKR